MSSVHSPYFVDEETDGQRDKETPSNLHGSQMVELGHPQRSLGLQTYKSDWNHGKDSGIFCFCNYE